MTEIAPQRYMFDTIEEFLENVDQDWLYEEFKDELFEKEDLTNMSMNDILRSIASYIISEGIVIHEKYFS